MSKPLVAVFFGGQAENYDLSLETGQQMCQYIPRSKYTVLPVHVTPQGLWQVPLGTLPQQGEVSRVITMLLEAVPPLTPKAGLERLFRQPVSAFFTLLRGPGGDDGSLQNLASTLEVPAVGSSGATCSHTAHKHQLGRLVDDITSTPYTRHFTKQTPLETIVEEARQEFIPPFFIKPTNQEGSVGVEEIRSHDELTNAIKHSQARGDVLLQERAPGAEIMITLFEDRKGSVHMLPPTLISPRKTPFYSHTAKRHPGHVTFDSSPTEDIAVVEAMAAARDIYDSLQCHGLVSMDMMIGEEGPYLLEVNTIPTFTAYTPLKEQLQAAHLHPTNLLDELLQASLGMNAGTTRR